MALNIFSRADMDPALHAALSDPNVSHTSIARDYVTSERAVRRWRARHAAGEALHTSAPEEPATSQPQKGKVSISRDGAEINNVVVEGDLNGDWSKVFDLFNLDGSKFVVVDDTVRMSTWQQSARAKDGSRDTIQLYSYSARFRRVTQDDIAPETVERWRVSIRETDTLELSLTQGGGGTYVALPSDPQIGKKGTAEAVENWKQGLADHLEEVRCQLAYGVPLDGLHIAFQGDEIEAVSNNYFNQSHTIELNMSQQLELAFDMEVWTIREALKVGLPLSVSAVISNHGEWTRNDSKDPVTTRSDNASTFLARQVKKFFDEQIQWGVPAIKWHIGGGEPGVIVPLSGVDNYFSHGYIEKGKGGSTELKTKNAIERQILGKTEELASVQNYFMAHYHHFYSNHFEGRNLFGCPALEAEKSSEYMLDQYGVWSKPGMLGLIVGDHNKQGWSNVNVF